MRIPTIIPVITSVALLSGCGVTEDLVRQEVGASEERLAARLAASEATFDQRLRRFDSELASVRGTVQAEGQARRQMIADLLTRQRDALVAQLRQLDETITALASQRAVASAEPTPH